MPSIVTTNGQINCVHGGRVTLVPKQRTVSIQGGMVLCEPDLVGAPIIGCAQPATPTTKPCTTVISTLPGSTSMTVAVEGRPAYVETLSGLTDGVPPGTLMVVSAGQASVSG